MSTSAIVIGMAIMALTAGATFFVATRLSRYPLVKAVQVVVWILWMALAGACVALHLIDPYISPFGGMDVSWGLIGLLVYWVIFKFESFLKSRFDLSDTTKKGKKDEQ